MASTGIFELMKAARGVMVGVTALSVAGVYYERAPRAADLPYVIFNLIPQGIGKSFQPGADHYRHYVVQTRVCTANQGNQEAAAVAAPLVKAVHECFTAGIGAQSPQNRLNALLNPAGWTALVPVECGEMKPYPDYLGDVERWNFINRYDLRIALL